MAASQVAQGVKNLPTNPGEKGLISGLGTLLGGGNGNPLQNSCLENPMDRGVWKLQSMGSQKVGQDWAQNNGIAVLIKIASSREIQRWLQGSPCSIPSNLHLTNRIHSKSNEVSFLGLGYRKVWLSSVSILFPLSPLLALMKQNTMLKRTASGQQFSRKWNLPKKSHRSLGADSSPLKTTDETPALVNTLT